MTMTVGFLDEFRQPSLMTLASVSEQKACVTLVQRVLRDLCLVVSVV
jgi:hypothetical protein